MGWLLADATVSGTDLSVFAQYGVLGVFVVILIIFARTSYKREIDRADRLETEVRRLNDQSHQDYERNASALSAAADAVREAVDLVFDLQQKLGIHAAPARGGVAEQVRRDARRARGDGRTRDKDDD